MPDIFVAPDRRVKEPESKRVEKTTKKAIAEKVVKPTKEKRASSLAAFISRPTNLRFETQERKEKIVLFLRRHLVTNIPWLITTLVAIFIPLAVVKVVGFDFIPGSYRLIAILAWYLLTFAFAFEKFLSWFFNVNIITDERIVDIDFPTILYKDMSETKIDQIQDVSVKVGGFIRSLFNFGDVLIQTAGTVPEIRFDAVPNPEQVSKILNELILEEEQEKLDGRVR